MEHDKHNEPDKHIREKLNSNELQPDASLWKEIEHELDKSKRRSIFFRKRYLLLLLLLIGGSTFYLLQRNDTSTSDNGIYSNDSKIVQPEINKSENKAPTQHSNQNLTDNTNNTKSVKSNADNTSHQVVITNSESKETATSNQTEKTSVVKSNESVESKNKSNQTIAAQQKKNQTTATETAPEQNIKSENEKSTSEILNQQETKKENVSAVENELVKKEGEVVLENIAKNVSDSMIAKIPEPIDTTVAAKNVDIIKIDSAVAVQDIPAVIDTTSTKPITPSRSIQWYVGIYTQLNSVSKTIGADNFSRPEYLQRRQDEETKANALSFGLRVGADINRFNVQSGVGIRSYADNIQYENRQLCYDIQNIGSLSAIVYDTVDVHPGASSIIGKSNGKAANRYLEIPLMVGYRLGGESFFIKPMFGAAVALPVSWSSEYINASVTTLENAKELNQLKPVVFNLLGELTATAMLSKKLYVDFGLNYNRNLSNIFKSETGISQHYSSWGGMLGLTYRF